MKQTKPKKKKKLNLWPVLIFLIGIGIILYPTASNYYNVVHQSGAITEFTESLSALDSEQGRKLWEEAEEYNRLLYLSQQGEDLPEDALKNYDEILHVADNGMMGYISIPKISAYLPIYHGTSDAVLQKGIGHWEISSFPIGGENTHAVMTGHTGLPSARLFTDLDQMEVGDRFVMQIIGETLTYEVEEINIVLPYEIEKLAVSEGRDLCTLVTCTPYGVNSHRLLVTAHRTENAPEEVASIEKAAEKNALTPMMIVIAIVSGCVLVLLIILFWGSGKRRKKKKQAAELKPVEDKTATIPEMTGEEEKPSSVQMETETASDTSRDLRRERRRDRRKKKQQSRKTEENH